MVTFDSNLIVNSVECTLYCVDYYNKEQGFNSLMMEAAKTRSCARCTGVSLFVVWVTVSYKLIARLHTEKASVLSISSEVVTQVSCSLRFSNS